MEMEFGKEYFLYIRQQRDVFPTVFISSLLICLAVPSLEDEVQRGPPSVHSSSSSHQSEGMDTYDLEQVNNIFRKLSLERYRTHTNTLTCTRIAVMSALLINMPVCRPFRPSLSSFSRISATLKPVQELSLQSDNLLKDITLVGGNDSGIFISSVQSGSHCEKMGLREGHNLLLVCSLRQ